MKRSTFAAAAASAVLVVTGLACDPPPAGEGEGEEGEGEEGEGEGEGEANVDCASPSADTLGVQVDPGWQLVDVVTPDASSSNALNQTDRLFADRNGNVRGFDVVLAVITPWGTWPGDFGASAGATVDPIEASHRDELAAVFKSTSASIDEDTLLFTYNLTIDNEIVGGVFIEGGAPMLATNPTSARRVGDRILVAASGFLDAGGAGDQPQNIFGFDLDDVPAGNLFINVGGGFTRLNLLDGDVIVSTIIDTVPSSYAFAEGDVEAAAAPLSLPASFHDEFVFDSFDYAEGDGAMVAVTGAARDFRAIGTGLAVLRSAGAGDPAAAQIDVPIVVDEACMLLTHAFSVGDDLVVGVLDTDADERRFFSVTPRCPVGGCP